jgi:DNA-binding transcriptional regulator YiaG
VATPANEELRAIMNEYGLSPKQVAELLGMTVEGVYNWTRTPETSGYRRMPDRMLKMLKLQLD